MSDDHDPEIFDKEVRPDGSEYYHNKWRDYVDKGADKKALRSYRNNYDQVYGKKDEKK